MCNLRSPWYRILEPMILLPLLFVIGIGGAVGTWLFGIRPYVCRRKDGWKTGANLAVAVWVDWQSCGEIARKEQDPVGRALYRAFGFFQLCFVLGLLGVFID